MIRPDDAARQRVEAEVRQCFERYESSLRAGDAAGTNSWFWHSPDVVRFGVGDRQVGYDAVAAWRQNQAPLPGRKLTDVRIRAFGDDIAVATTLFSYGSSEALGRQSQVWARLEEGWRIVSAHVSELVGTQPPAPGR